MGRGELLAYDNILSQYLTQDVLLSKLKRELQEDKDTLCQVGEARLHSEDCHGSDAMQEQKSVNLQRNFNHEVVNEDALYKLLAYQGSLQKKRLTDPEVRKDFLTNPKNLAAFDTFEDWYKEELMRNARQAPRSFDESEFLPQRRREKSTLYAPVRAEHTHEDLVGYQSARDKAE